MVAASRKPRLRPCAPIGGMTCAASPISATRPAPRRAAVSTASWKTTATGLDRDLAQDRMRAALDLGRHLRVRKRREARDVGGINHEYQARSLSGQRHQRERAGLGVKFGRRVVMGTAVAEVEGERSLAVGSAVSIDAGSGAAQRTAPLSADREARRYRAPIAPDDHSHRSISTAGGFVFDARQCCQAHRRALRARR